MYVALYKDMDGEGDTLFYYSSEEAATRMRNSGVQTQQGYLRMRSVKSIEISTDEKISSINVFTQDKVLSWALDNPISYDIYHWLDILRLSAVESHIECDS
jgi:hypothetical protein